VSLAIVVLFAFAEASGQKASQNFGSEISEQEAITIAKNEILRRGLSLPRNAKPWAAPVSSDTEPVRPIYWVVFVSPAKAEEGIHGYEVMLERESGKVIDFVDPRTFITAQAAIKIAKKELSKRGLSLPNDWGIDVGHGATPGEVTPERPLFVVSFYPPEKDKRSAIYQVTVEKRAGKVESFSDYRMTIALSGAIQLKGIGKEHLKSLNSALKEKRFKGVQIHTSKTGIISITPPLSMSDHDKADLERLIRREIKGAEE
jgi:hypothetical protein